MSTIKVTNLSGRGGASPNLPDGANVTGVLTATSFVGSGANLTGLANTDFVVSEQLKVLGITTVGVVTGGTYYGDGSNLTGVGETIAPWNYNPDVNDTLAPVATGIGITFNKKVVAGSGTATIKIVNAGTAGTTIQSWGVSSCTFGVTEVTFGSLVSNLTVNQTYQVDIPATFIDDSAENSYVGTAWTFTVQDASYKLFTWGYDGDGMLGQSSVVNKSSPVQLPGTNWGNTSFSGGGNTIKFMGNIRTDGTLWVWGSGDYGQLGNNGTAHVSSPIQIGSGTDWSTLSVGGQGWTATKTDGTLWVAGRNNVGQLGQNSEITYSSPIQIPGTTWSKSSHGNTFSYAIRTDGTLWSWGEGLAGALGQGGTDDRSSPVQIPGTTWRSVELDSNLGVLATKTDNTLWSWGKNGYGRLGQNNNTYYSSPKQIPGTTWAAADIEDNHGMATKTDGTLWSWGANEKGQLGQNAPESSHISSPVQIPGTSWTTEQGGISCGTYGPIAIKTDGTIWTWGDKAYGQLAQNNQTEYSSPVQIGSGTDWSRVRKFNKAAMALQKDETP